jgi:cellulose synthase/poly-beta-1,6-N-acetylglucosamine synthase-like glycosyltransferase
LIAVYIALHILRKPPLKEKITQISVVLAARNEEDRIKPCLESLERLDYPPEKYEIIIVDDHSWDKTVEIVKSFCDRNRNWRLILLDVKSKKLLGKKNALLHGIAQATGEIIFTTDADCIVPRGWLRNMSSYFAEDVSMVLGYSPLLPGKGFLYRLLQFDNLFSAISAAAPTILGYPFTSVGRNLAYRKEAYENAGGFLALKKFRSGDDVHLTERFRYLKNGKIDYCANPDTFILTQAPSTISEFFHQQVRKNSKTLKKAGTSIAFSVVLFIYHILLIAFPILLPSWIMTWLGIVVIKFTLELASLIKAALIFRQKQIIPFIPVMQILYPGYIIFFSILGILDFYSWKK